MGRRLPTFITEEEFEKIYSHIESLEKSGTKNKIKRLRHYRLAILLGFESGMRISEIVGLKKLYSKCCESFVIYSSEYRIIDGIKKKYRVYSCSKCDKPLQLGEMHRTSKDDWEILPLTKEFVEKNRIKINQGKGKKDRVVPRPKRMNQKALDLLPLKLRRRALQNFFSEITKKLLKKQMHFHSLRHGFCSHLAGKGVPLHQIQMLAGHSNLETTGIYLHANPTEAIENALNSF